LSIHKISIEEFVSLSTSLPIFDVRSPGEFVHAHFPNAINLPLFTDEERKFVGTAYKQKGKQEAIKLGLNYFGPKMSNIISMVESNCKTTPSKVLIHCWRGGMRSGGVAWLLDLYGFEVYVLTGGYKAFRNWALSVFSKPYTIRILGGYTGSAKTDILIELQLKQEQVINLEGIANHKGSAFGGISQPEQPTQEMFENMLALEFNKQEDVFWIEDESQRIGKLNIPPALWQTMRMSPVYFLDIPFEERLNYILEGYGGLNIEKMIEAVERIQKRFGPLETKTTISFLQEGEIKEAFSLLLKYYDKHYSKSLQNRTNLQSLLHKITLPTTSPKHNTEVIIKETQSS
jgi:tRNA 2-selenouridine synthase